MLNSLMTGMSESKLSALFSVMKLCSMYSLGKALSESVLKPLEMADWSDESASMCECFFFFNLGIYRL